ncbi:histidine kinase dimerization/phospho-acceptor domain-containing protein [Bacillus safensis]|uniref:sensor histidine kinase n=1 Tax=Bacillus safensis TaxID=561879 RepID=UPI00382BBC08
MLRTIESKFLIGFLLIFFLSFLVLNQTVKKVIWSNNENIVTSDLIELKKNSLVYMNQAFLINHYKNDELYFGDMSSDIVENLSHSTGNNVGVYTLDGKLLTSSNETVFSKGSEDDLKHAINGKDAYHITYDQHQADVFYSFPVVIDGTKVGILRFSKNFDLLYKQSGEVLNIIFNTALIIFLIAFLFSYILSRHITIPIVKLSKASSKVKKGNLDVDIQSHRHDEIGQLTTDFNDMIKRIKDQISTIENDRDRLKVLNEQEKRFFDHMTHELKTPLTSIQGYAEIIKHKGEKDPVFFQKGMNHIVSESRRLHNLVIKLLEVSRETPSDLKFQKLNAGTILKDVCESMNFRAERYKKKIIFDIEDELYVYGERNRLRQLFINLLDNAIKYSLPTSEIIIRGNIVNQTYILFLFQNPSDPLENSEKKTSDPSLEQHNIEKGSRGLGLDIAKTIVDEHKGSFEISFEYPKTIVKVKLPYIEVETYR